MSEGNLVGTRANLDHDTLVHSLVLIIMESLISRNGSLGCDLEFQLPGLETLGWLATKKDILDCYWHLGFQKEFVDGPGF
jgi:hypothetical protein